MNRKQREWLDADVARADISGYSIKRLIDPWLAELSGITGDKFEESDTLYDMPHLSRESLFDLLRVTVPENALALICGKHITSKEEAVSFLEANALESLIVDSGAMVDEAIARRVDLSLLLDMVKERRICHWRYNMSCSMVDLAALYGTSLRDMEVDFLLVDGGNTWSYIKSVGITNIRMFGEALLPLEDVYTPQEVHSIIARADREMDNPADRGGLQLSKAERISLLSKTARAIGLDETLQLRSPGAFHTLRYHLGNTPDAAAARFMDEIIQLSSQEGSMSLLAQKRWFYKASYLFHKQGFSPEDALGYMEQGIDVQRAAAIRDEGVPAAVSSGWL